MGVDGFSWNMDLHGVSNDLLKEGRGVGDVVRVVVRKRVAFDLGGDGCPVGIPVGTTVVVDNLGRGCRARSWRAVVSGCYSEQDREVVATCGIKDVDCDTPEEVGGGNDNIGGGVTFGTGVFGKGKLVPLDRGEELMPPP